SVTQSVHARFVRFFQQDVEAIGQAERDLLIVLDRDAPMEDARQALGRLGLPFPNSLELVRDLAFGTREVFISAEGQRSFEQMLPSLLRMIASAAAPQRVLPHLHSFVL